MQKNKILQIVVAVIVSIVLISSGWVYNLVSKNNELVKGNEMASLQTTFTQQYGSSAVIKQLVAPSKVYAALWTDGENISHVSWNIGGLWVTVWNSSSSATALSPTLPEEGGKK